MCVNREKGESMARVLLVDDEHSLRAILGQILAAKGHTPLLCGGTKEALDVLAEQSVDLVVTDIRMEPVDGMVLLKEVRSIQPDTPVVMMTAHASVETALDALKEGAYDYLTKPFKVVDFINVVDNALAGVGEKDNGLEGEGSGEEQYCFGQVVGVSPAMLEACRLLELVAPTDATVLLHGEDGTGRGLLAHTVHEKSLRAGEKCIAIRCGELPGKSSGEHEGVKEGGAEGTGQDLAAVLMGASGGTVILENVERLSSSGQALLLGLLRDKSIGGKGGEAEEALNVRIVATAGPGLEKSARDGDFDEELYKRLGLLSIQVKPLCERREDIVPLFRHFLLRTAGDESSMPVVSADVRGALLHYVWPGNVRELKHLVEYACAHTVSGSIVRQSLPQAVLGTLTVGDYGQPVPDMGGNKASALKSFLKKKGVELTDAMSGRNNGSGSATQPRL